MFLKVCPRCGSDDIVWTIPQNWSMWECNNCDYTGAVIEVDENVQRMMIERWENHVDEELNDNIDDDMSDEEFEKKMDELFMDMSK